MPALKTWTDHMTGQVMCKELGELSNRRFLIMFKIGLKIELVHISNRLYILSLSLRKIFLPYGHCHAA